MFTVTVVSRKVGTVKLIADNLDELRYIVEGVVKHLKYDEIIITQ